MNLARAVALTALLLTRAEILWPQERAVRDSLDRLRAELVRGYNDGNAAALEKPYVSDAVRMVYDAPVQRGKEEIAQALRRSFANRRADVQLALRPVEIQFAGDFALE